MYEIMSEAWGVISSFTHRLCILCNQKLIKPYPIAIQKSMKCQRADWWYFAKEFSFQKDSMPKILKSICTRNANKLSLKAAFISNYRCKLCIS